MDSMSDIYEEIIEQSFIILETVLKIVLYLYEISDWVLIINCLSKEIMMTNLK
jgi:hypothetical protein